MDSLENEIAPHILRVSLADSPADPLACDQNGESVTPNLHVRRKSWQDAGGQSMTEIVENISRSHRHSLSSEAVQLSVPGSVESKVKLFTELAEVKCCSPESASKGSHEVEGEKETLSFVHQSGLFKHFFVVNHYVLVVHNVS